uniref:Uncharacterized protein n=1 Tax=Glossina austeni TaxID=7395 RepID=A0A1A9V1G3_GLOAU
MSSTNCWNIKERILGSTSNLTRNLGFYINKALNTNQINATLKFVSLQSDPDNLTLNRKDSEKTLLNAYAAEGRWRPERDSHDRSFEFYEFERLMLAAGLCGSFVVAVNQKFKQSL